LVSDVELMLSDSKSTYENIKNNLELYKEKLISKKKFEEQWEQFITESKSLIKKTSQIEESCFPKENKNFENIEKVIESYQSNLNQYISEVKVI
jgi:uncharacterized protein YozE (UPF0346 family)